MTDDELIAKIEEVDVLISEAELLLNNAILWGFVESENVLRKELREIGWYRFRLSAALCARNLDARKQS